MEKQKKNYTISYTPPTAPPRPAPRQLAPAARSASIGSCACVGHWAGSVAFRYSRLQSCAKRVILTHQPARKRSVSRNDTPGLYHFDPPAHLLPALLEESRLRARVQIKIFNGRQILPAAKSFVFNNLAFFTPLIEQFLHHLVRLITDFMVKANYISFVFNTLRNKVLYGTANALQIAPTNFDSLGSRLTAGLCYPLRANDLAPQASRGVGW